EAEADALVDAEADALVEAEAEALVLAEADALVLATHWLRPIQMLRYLLRLMHWLMLRLRR
ncbi:hypothetical protein, partial [Streptococcus pneumoniae]|uniref:hypothetical protein n=1 Tax=Streptococcus pneumoniae TaxID=1313 RepID=UPI000A5635CB